MKYQTRYKINYHNFYTGRRPIFNSTNELQGPVFLTSKIGSSLETVSAANGYASSTKTLLLRPGSNMSRLNTFEKPGPGYRSSRFDDPNNTLQSIRRHVSLAPGIASGSFYYVGSIMTISYQGTEGKLIIPCESNKAISSTCVRKINKVT